MKGAKLTEKEDLTLALLRLLMEKKREISFLTPDNTQEKGNLTKAISELTATLKKINPKIYIT